MCCRTPKCQGYNGGKNWFCTYGAHGQMVDRDIETDTVNTVQSLKYREMERMVKESITWRDNVQTEH